MKTILSSRVALALGSALLVGIPTAVLLPGCGGGSSSGPTARLFSAPVQLSATQTANLNLSLVGSVISGNLIVGAATPVPVAAGRAAAALPATVPAGTYTLTGTFLPLRAFSLTGTFPEPAGDFTVTGEIPLNGVAGFYTLTNDGATVKGTIPVISPTSTPVPTVTPIPSTTPGGSATATPTTRG